MVRFGVALAALACMAVPALAQESTEQLKKELQELRAEVDGLKAVNQSKEIPAQGKVDANAMAADDNPVMTLFKGTKLSGFVDVGYEFSFNRLSTDRVPNNTGALQNTHNPTRIFDNRDNSFYMHEAHLQLERLADKNMIVGYHIELAVGHDPSIYDGSTFTAQEAWVQILAPVGAGLDIRAGKMATLVGFEVLENVNNMNYSRGMLFGIIQPFTHTGVRVAYGMGGANNDMVTFTLGFNNGLNSTAGGPTATDMFADLDHGKAVEFQVAVKPIKDLLVALTMVTGNDTASGTNVSTKDEFYVFDIVASYTMDKLTVGLNVDFSSAQQTDLTVPKNPTRTPFSGVAVYGKYSWTDAMASALRVEYLSDQKGAVFGPVAAGDTGTGARIFEFTLTQEIKVANQLIVRIEFRHDDSNQHTFVRNEKPARGDNTLGFEAIMPF
jgi:hypothetical protein